MKLAVQRFVFRRMEYPVLGTQYFVLVAVLAAAAVNTPALAQVKDDEPSAGGRIQYGPPSTIGYRAGAEITASRGACRDIVALVAIPLVCPEQQVRIADEDISSEVGKVDYRPLPGGEVKQMVITIPRLPDGATARALVTFEVITRPILPPEKTDDLKIPEHPPKGVRQFLGGSPFIETKSPKIAKLGKEVWADLDESTTDWQKVEAIYDYVLQHVDYVEGPDKSALDALHDKQADCQGRSMLFIALCRVNKIPARMVWVDHHAYPEFYLEDADKHGYWFPAESAGTRAFGEMPLARTILQKGDNFVVPERAKDHLRYASDYLVGLPVGNSSGRPKARFVHEQVPLGHQN